MLLRTSFYDRTTSVWEEIWSDHLHHGYYTKTTKNNYEAQVEMIEQLLKFNVGCGIGGSSMYITQHYLGVQCYGITISSKQVQTAINNAQKMKLTDTCEFQLANALSLPFPNEIFDIVYSMESGEHIPDKRKFMSQMNYVLKSGGDLFMMATWCHRTV
ncbi:unnamed protein product [Didymodactylos carnosus]|uniref:Methyltransferase type 11 domain-containing protein n=1 Tax=Didymodactylos carnosus TaxID=1234261 RepID=A0A814V0L0_9BILA|nr:unnamed protein product [Didymodactylos carnosus]CAF1181758.1 unnamed protein product [Didymodactylos carnosus]CAF3827419.1 unnamed protein product [Didymodactylos carnosus]CAF3946123.1 unnamed protein product [Didymodactylos carnosus]